MSRRLGLVKRAGRDAGQINAAITPRSFNLNASSAREH
jgi:hypothetical protein